MHLAAAFQRRAFVRGLCRKFWTDLSRRNGSGRAAIGVAQPIAFQNHDKEILGEILSILGRVSLAADVRKNRMPVSAA